MQMFTKRFWLIQRANLRLTKYQYFFNWQNTLKIIFAFGFLLPIFLAFVTFPKWILDKVDDFTRDNMPDFLKVDENPDWLKMGNSQRREFMDTLKDWQ